MSQLFIFTFGPVQGLIANSRKLRDMRAGSELLSKIAAEAIRWLEAREIKIIFPVLSAEQSAAIDLPNIPNRLIAEFPAWPDEELTSAAQELTAHIRRYFLEQVKQILADGGLDDQGIARAQKQLSDFLEIYWLFTPYEDDKYQEAYLQLFSGINAVKSVRPFAQSQEPWSRKCALFPQYNAIFARRSADGRYPYLVNEHMVCKLPDDLKYQVKASEALSAMALVKRLYHSSEMDIYSLRLMMLKSRLPKELKNDEALLAHDADDVSNVIYELANDNVPSTDDYAEETIAKARLFYQKLQEHHVVLSSYYALIKFDGDNMGERFRVLSSPEDQKKLSQSLSTFATQALVIMKDHKGLPIYAGGEDFFGFVPLETLFDCLTELHAAFYDVTELTFSAGVAIAHLMQPLKDVTAAADRLEEAAKDTKDKNAFALGLLKRSGEWLELSPYSLGNEPPCLQNVAHLVNALAESHYPKSLLYNIGQLLEPLSLSEPQPPWAMVAPLIEQIMVRSKISADHAAALLTDLQLFYQDKPLRAFLDTLNAAAFIAREVK